MNRRSAVRRLLAAGAGSLFTRLGAAQKSGPEESTELPTFESDVRLVLLDVSVKDKKGDRILGLPKESFSVFENGRSQPITVFERNDLPVTVGILVDESRSMAPKRGDVLIAAQTFIEESNPLDETFVLNFNDTVKPGLPPGTIFSDDLKQLRSALYRGVSEGRTALNDAVVAGLKQLELGRTDKKALILISDGGDNASHHTRHETLLALEESMATVYAIGLFAPEDDKEMDPGILRQLARISGGEAFFPATPADMIPVCRGIAKDIRTRYTIGYRPQANGREPLRHIRVGVSARGHSRLIVRTRASYRFDRGESRN